MKKFFAIVLISFFFFTIEAQEVNHRPSFSLEFSAGGGYAYQNQITTDPNSNYFVTPMAAFGYLINENSQVTIYLMRYSWYPSAQNSLMIFGYGFGFRHYIPKVLLDLGIFDPFVSYGILLNQGIVTGQSGRGIAHDTRLSLGTDLIFSEKTRIIVEGVWDLADFSSFNQSQSISLSSLTLFIGIRQLF